MGLQPQPPLFTVALLLKESLRNARYRNVIMTPPYEHPHHMKAVAMRHLICVCHRCGSHPEWVYILNL